MADAATAPPVGRDRTMQVTYALETLYEHQDSDFVLETIPDVLAWVQHAEASDTQPFVFNVEVARTRDVAPETLEIALVWSIEALEQRDPGLRAGVARRRSGRTPHREHVPELAAYGLALVAISVLMPGRRVIGMSFRVPPDFLLDDTPGALRGVEVAGRSSGGVSALRAVRRKKIDRVIALPDLTEVHLSLWCANPRVGQFHQVKP